MKTLLAVFAVLLLAGCSTLDNGMKAQVLGANIEIAKERAQAAAKPVLNAAIPIAGCKAPDGADWKAACVMTIIVHAPQGPNNGQIAVPEDPMWRVLDRGMGVLGTAAGIYLGGAAATNIIESTTAGIVSGLSVQKSPTVVMQPPPVVVPPAEPVIVTRPDPVVVNAPDPVIVNPVVIPASGP